MSTTGNETLTVNTYVSNETAMILGVPSTVLTYLGTNELVLTGETRYSSNNYGEITQIDSHVAVNAEASPPEPLEVAPPITE